MKKNAFDQSGNSPPANAGTTLAFVSHDFVGKASAFFRGKPTSRNSFDTISLLLFLDIHSGSYFWYYLPKGDAIQQAVEYAMEKKHFAPVGAAWIVFEERTTGKVHLSEETDTFVDGRLDREEVLNATIPYFMRDNFNYKLEDVKFTDLERN
jgi:hypothetical protein